MEHYTFAVVTSIIICIVFYLIINNNKYWKRKCVAGPEPIPIFGNILQYMLGRKNLGTIYKEIYDAYPNEKVIGFYRMLTPCLLIKDPEIVKNILIHDFDIFPDRGIYFSKEHLGDNLFHADGETWAFLRNKFTSVFTTEKLRGMMTKFVDTGDELLKHIENLRLKNTEQNVFQLISLYSVSTTLSCIFGVSYNTFDDEINLPKVMDDAIFNTLNAGKLELTLPGILTKLNMTLYGKPIVNFSKQITKYICQTDDNLTKQKDFTCIVRDLLNEGEIEMQKDPRKRLKITDKTIAGQAFIFYTAGYVNSASIISLLLYELARNTDIQNELAKEIDDVLDQNNGQLTYDSVNKMNLVKRAFDEALRMYTPTISLSRQTVRDYKIPNTDIVIEKGQSVVISPYAFHRDKKYYPDPDQFDPDRFHQQNLNNIQPYTYLPFGAGPRGCLGLRFGKLQAYVCIAKIISKYRFELSENTKCPETHYDPYRSMIFPKNGVHLIILPRNTGETV